MKAIILFAITVSSFVTLAGNDKYTQAMLKNIKALSSSSTSEELSTVFNAFERISRAEATRWEPLYYMAYTRLLTSLNEKDAVKKDQYIDEAESVLEKALLLAPEEAEIIAAQGFCLMLRVSVDPASRGPVFAPRSVQAFQKALAIDPENPRATVLLARMQLGTAQFFGSSTDEACATARLALLRFENFKSDNVLQPDWGKNMAESLVALCK